MGKYSGRRTQSALDRAKAFYADRDFVSELANALAKTKQFIEDNKRRPKFGFLAGLCEAKAHRNCVSPKDIQSIDFDDWRLAKELRLLQWRMDSITPLAQPKLSWVTVSSRMDLAISLSLTDREGLAFTIFENLASGLGPVLQRMSSQKDKPREWGAISFVFRSVLSSEKLPKPLTGAENLTLKEAQAARPTYSDARDPYGSLLGGPAADLIPVELIFLSRALGHSDPDLAELDARIRATSYPTNEVFQEIDVELSVAGI